MKYLIAIGNFFKKTYICITTFQKRFIDANVNKLFWSKFFTGTANEFSWVTPKGETLYIKSLTFSIGRNNANKPIRFCLLASYKNEPFVSFIEMQLMSNYIQQYLDIPLIFKENTDIKITVIGETSGVHCLLTGYITKK